MSSCDYNGVFKNHISHYKTYVKFDSNGNPLPLDDSQLVNLSEKKKDHQKAFIEGGYSLNNLPKLSSKRPRATASESFQSMFKIQKMSKGEGEGDGDGQLCPITANYELLHHQDCVGLLSQSSGHCYLISYQNAINKSKLL